MILCKCLNIQLKCTKPTDHKLGSGGGGGVVSLLTFFSDIPSLHPDEVYCFSVRIMLEKSKKNKKWPDLGHFKNKLS